MVSAEVAGLLINPPDFNQRHLQAHEETKMADSCHKQLRTVGTRRNIPKTPWPLLELRSRAVPMLLRLM